MIGDEPVKVSRTFLDSLVAERDAALAECERLRELLEDHGIVIDNLHTQYQDERDAWRACADQLAAALEGWGHPAAALAVYETLKGAS